MDYTLLSVMRAWRLALLRHSPPFCVVKHTCLLRALRAVLNAGCELWRCARLPALALSAIAMPLRLSSEVFTGIASSMLSRK